MKHKPLPLYLATRLNETFPGGVVAMSGQRMKQTGYNFMRNLLKSLKDAIFDN